ncbi:hypothetical protein [uncultured Draconibacterium sp.]|uniref:hypothetical protein n=1 Tax=uncultured Draconibacterium sp. TaxID=1573823 RepID=UPI0029C840C4|nr:hypothetical protein [uncultured Draconibacterium sp.]
MGIIFKEFVIFLKHPIIEKSDALSFGKSISFIIKSIGLYVIFTLLYAIIVGALYFLLDLKVTDFGSKATQFFKIVIMAPVIEELLFRLPLKNFFKNIFISLGILTFLFLRDNMPLVLAISLGLGVVLLPYVAKFIRKLEGRINSFIYHHYGVLFYFLAFSFGVLHILNSESFTSDLYLSAFIYFIHPLISGLYFAFIRVRLKYGIIYSILVHALTNLLPFLPILLRG